jgi:hypothetical protein
MMQALYAHMNNKKIKIKKKKSLRQNPKNREELLTHTREFLLAYQQVSQYKPGILARSGIMYSKS